MRGDFDMTTQKLKKEAEELWTQFTAVLESTACEFDTIRPILVKIKRYYDRVDPILAIYVNQVLLKEGDAQVHEWDGVRQLLHGEFDSAVRETWDIRTRLYAQYQFVLRSAKK